jgi:hypothetical protein
MNRLKKLFKSDSSTDKHHESQPQSTLGQSTSVPAQQSSATAGKESSGVLLTTNYGDITIALYADKAPRVRYAPDFHEQGADPISLC